ncbi:MAG: hypothetical protein QM831_09915 [Kofleriaceae bacterium]
MMPLAKRSMFARAPRSEIVMAPVVQHIRERVAHLARCSELDRVIAIAKHRAATTARPPAIAADVLVDVLGARAAEDLHAASESDLVVGLDHQVKVEVLDRVVNDPERFFEARHG